MASSVVEASLEGRTYKLFNEIGTERFCKAELVGRLIHFWEARNPNKGGLLMGLQLLLIDEKSSVISAFIGATRVWRYQRLLQPNSIYLIKNFTVKDAGKLYSLSNHKFTLQFIDQTVIEAVAEETYSIETQKFRICDFQYFEANADQRSCLFDVIGQVTLISGDNISNPEALEGGPVILESRQKDRVTIHLSLKDGTPVRVTLWDNTAASFRKKIQQGEIVPTVLLVTTVNPKLISVWVMCKTKIRQSRAQMVQSQNWKMLTSGTSMSTYKLKIRRLASYAKQPLWTSFRNMVGITSHVLSATRNSGVMFPPLFVTSVRILIQLVLLGTE